MKQDINAGHVAPQIADRITDCTKIKTAIEILKLCHINQAHAAERNLTKEIELAAARITGTLDGLLWQLGYEIRHTSPLVTVCVPKGTPLHKDLSHVGAVGEGSMPETDPDLAPNVPRPVQSTGQSRKPNTARTNTKRARKKAK